MSMNLYFRVKDGSGMIDFPFQTPTELTYAVMEAETTQDRLALIKQYLERFEENTPEEIAETLEILEFRMNSKHLDLTLM